MSLTQRLKQLQQPIEEASLPDLTHLTLEDLHKEKVDFGNKHRGETFETAWKDQSWMEFISSHYSQSKHLPHRKVIRYIEQITHLPDVEEADWELSSQTYQHGYTETPDVSQPNFLAHGFFTWKMHWAE